MPVEIGMASEMPSKSLPDQVAESCSTTGSSLRSNPHQKPSITPSETQTNPPAPTPLFAAAKSGKDSIVQFLLQQGADVNDGGCHGSRSVWSPLCTAAQNGHESTVKILLDDGANVHMVDERGWGAILIASKNGHAGIVNLLLQRGANASATDEGGWTPLHIAAKYGRTEVVKVLLECGADTRVRDNMGSTPMLIAIWKGHEAIVSLLSPYEFSEPPPSYESSVTT
jgi:ankyrin repeat protein